MAVREEAQGTALARPCSGSVWGQQGAREGQDGRGQADWFILWVRSHCRNRDATWLPVIVPAAAGGWAVVRRRGSSLGVVRSGQIPSAFAGRVGGGLLIGWGVNEEESRLTLSS